MKNLQFRFSDELIYNIPPNDYLLEGSDFDIPGFCIIGVSYGDYGMYILGDVFLKGFYSVYDFDNKKVGLALHPHSRGSIDGYRRDWILPVVIVVVIIVIAGAVAFFFWKRNRDSQLQ
jgi:hypothetical protein